VSIENENLVVKVQTLNAENSRMQLELAEKNNHIAQLSKELEKRLESDAKLRNELNATILKNTELQTSITTLEDELSSCAHGMFVYLMLYSVLMMLFAELKYLKKKMEEEKLSHKAAIESLQAENAGMYISFTS
jgi:chromosome segregation ATPase